jgi:hypothetical protein
VGLEREADLVEPGAQRLPDVEVRLLPEQLYRNAERQFDERVRILKNLPESPR